MSKQLDTLNEKAGRASARAVTAIAVIVPVAAAVAGSMTYNHNETVIRHGTKLGNHNETVVRAA